MVLPPARNTLSLSRRPHRRARSSFPRPSSDSTLKTGLESHSGDLWKMSFGPGVTDMTVSELLSRTNKLTYCQENADASSHRASHFSADRRHSWGWSTIIMVETTSLCLTLASGRRCVRMVGRFECLFRVRFYYENRCFCGVSVGPMKSLSEI